jgi:general secretion pathway protein D
MDHPTPEGKSLLNVYYLEHANAEDMVLILTEAQEAIASASGGQAAGGSPQKTEAGGTIVGGTFKAMGEDISITADKSTNSLIIYAKPDDYNALKGMIQKLDIPRKQVFIESLIIEVDPEETFEFGTEWQAFKDVSPTTGIFGASKGSPSGLDALPPAGQLGEGFSLGVLTEGISVGGFTFPSLSILIRALETLDTVSILSRPQLLTLNNETAIINVSENRPFETAATQSPNVGVTQNIEYRDVGIILEITPHINKGGKVRVETNLTVSKLAGVSAQVNPTQPVTLKRVIDTVIEVQDGGTVIIGGLIEKQIDYTRTQVPCFGSIPFLGWGFKGASMTEQQTNLIIFIAPQVFDRPQDAEPLSIEKKEFIEEKLRRENQDRLDELPFFRKDKEGILGREEDYFGE